METSPNVSKRGKDAVQSECQIPGEAELAEPLGNIDPNANRGVEPNFNLNLNLTSQSNPRLRLHGGNKKDDGNKLGGRPGAKGAVTMETGKSASTLTTTVMSPGERDDPSRQKSKIPALSRSPTAEASVNSRGEQRLKSPNPKNTPTLMMASPKPHRVEQTTIASSPRTTERVKTQILSSESASVLNPKPHIAVTTELTTKTTSKITMSLKMQTNTKEDGTQSPQTLQLPLSPKVHNQRGDLNIISPKLVNRTPTINLKTPKSEPASKNEQTRQDSRTHSSEMPSVGPKSQNQWAESALLSTKTKQPSSLSPKPSTQRKARTSNMTESKENLESKDLSIGSGSKSSSNSKATTASKDSLDAKTASNSKASPNSKTLGMGSRDSLDSKSGSVSKTSLGSKDSLDSKTGLNSKASPNSKSRMGSRDSLDSKTGMGSKSGTGSKDELDPKNLKISPSCKNGSELILSSNSDLSGSKPGQIRSTSKPSLVASGSKIDLVTSVSQSSSRTGLSGSKDDHLKTAGTSAKLSPDPKAGSDSSKPGPVRSSSKSALADLSTSLTLSPRPGSASRSPGSGPGKGLGYGPSKEVQRSPGSAPGNLLSHCLIKGCIDPELRATGFSVILRA